jgi:hypothetical protein
LPADQSGLIFDPGNSGWHPCSFRGRPGTRVFGEWLVTNRTDESVLLNGVSLAYREAEIADVSTSGGLKNHCLLEARARTSSNSIHPL